MKSRLFWLLTFLTLCNCTVRKQELSGKTISLHTAIAPQLDGIGNEICWKDAAIYPIDQLWSGKLPFAADYMGRFRASWDSSHLYLLIEIMDDSLMEQADHIDLYLGTHPVESDPVTFSFYGDTSIGFPHQSTLPYPSAITVQRAVNEQSHLTTWEIAVPLAHTASNTIPFALCYHDVDKPTATADRMGNVPLQADPKKSKDVIYRDDLGKMVLEVKEHK